MGHYANKVIVVSLSGRTPTVEKTLEKIIASGVKMIAIVGKDCRLLEDICDEICVGDGANVREVQTHSHPDEDLEWVKELTSLFCANEWGTEVQVVEL
jgi:hypothetical protein